MVQNDKKLCLLHFISQEPCIMWLLSLVHICKMIISSGVLFIFPKFWFSRSIGGQKGKKWSRMTKNYVCCTPYLRNHTSYDCHLWCKCVKLYLQVFFFYFKILIFWVVMGLKGQKMAQNDKKFCLTLYLRNCTSYDCDFWYTCKMMISSSNFFIFQNFDFFGGGL